jgi:hypothetical protein
MKETIKLLFQVEDPKAKDLMTTVSLLEREYSSSREEFLESFVLCITRCPFKISVYATITALLNSRSFDIGHDLVLAAGKQLQLLLDTLDFVGSKLLVLLMTSFGTWQSVSMQMLYCLLS